VALGRRLVQPIIPGRLTWLPPPAPLRRGDTHTKFAIGRENPVTNSSGMNLDNRRLPEG
jgi:hypothetical protein